MKDRVKMMNGDRAVWVVSDQVAYFEGRGYEKEKAPARRRTTRKADEDK